MCAAFRTAGSKTTDLQTDLFEWFVSWTPDCISASRRVARNPSDYGSENTMTINTCGTDALSINRDLKRDHFRLRVEASNVPERATAGK